MLVHNHAVQYLARDKNNGCPVKFWATPIAAIKPKYVQYLKSIDYRLKVLEDTPRTNSGDKTTHKVTVKGLFSDFNTAKSYVQQTPLDQKIELVMDKELCRLYGDSSREIAKNIDVATTTNIEALANLAIMELQFMIGCTVDWRKSNGNGGKAASASESQILAGGSADDDADDSEPEGEDESLEGGHYSHDEDYEFDFSRIDCADLLNDTVTRWETLDYEDTENFVGHRESLAMATLFCLSEELGAKYPKLKSQVHAGWMHAFKRPITMDQLLDPPSEFNFKWTEEEEDWFDVTKQTLVDQMSQEQREGMGITPEHLQRLTVENISATQQPPVSPNPNIFQTFSSASVLQLCLCRLAADVISLPQGIVAAKAAKTTRRGSASAARADIDARPQRTVPPSPPPPNPSRSMLCVCAPAHTRTHARPSDSESSACALVTANKCSQLRLFAPSSRHHCK